MQNKSFKKQLPINLISNIAVFSLGIIINLFLTPFYIKSIGIEGLGIIRLAVSIPAYANLASIVISGSVSRFLTIDIQNNDIASANKTFNSAFFGVLAILLIVYPCILLFSFHIHYIFDIPDSLLGQSAYLFLGVLSGSSVALLSSIFLIPAYANNRLDVNNVLKIIALLTQNTIIVVFLTQVGKNLSYIGLAYFSGAISTLLLSLQVWKKYAPGIKLRIKYLHFSKLKELSSMGTWLLINQMGSILFLYVDLIVINIFFGSEATGDYSIPLQWSVLLRSMAGVVSGVIAPIILICYSKKEFEKIVRFSKIGVKFMGIAMAIPIGLLMGFSAPLFKLWLGDDFVFLVPVLLLMICHLPVNLAILPLFSINTAFNKVKLPGLISLGFGLCNLLLAVVLSVYLKLNIYGVALAGAIVLTLKNAVFTPIYAAYILDINKMSFIKPILASLVVAGITFSISYIIADIVYIDQWHMLLSYGFFVMVAVMLVIWKLMLSVFEKKFLIKQLRIGN